MIDSRFSIPVTVTIVLPNNRTLFEIPQLDLSIPITTQTLFTYEEEKSFNQNSVMGLILRGIIWVKSELFTLLEIICCPDHYEKQLDSLEMRRRSPLLLSRVQKVRTEGLLAIVAYRWLRSPLLTVLCHFHRA